MSGALDTDPDLELSGLWSLRHKRNLTYATESV